MQKSILDVTVSCFANYKSTEPKDVNLLKWLQTDKYKAQCEQVRSSTNTEQVKHLKSHLPAITVSGTFSKRCKSGFLKHSGFMCIDIDKKDNTEIENFDDLKTDFFNNFSEVAYSGLSVSGNGFFLIIPIQHPDKHLEHFLALEKAFSECGVKVDTMCKNIDRLRGASYDQNAYFNHNATPYTGLYEAPKATLNDRKVKFLPTSDRYDNSETAKVERCIKQITSNHIDITGDYQTWFSVGSSLAAEFGESGREYYHLVSQYHSKYKHTDTDRQYSHCLKCCDRFSISTFYNICLDYGISYKI